MLTNIRSYLAYLRMDVPLLPNMQEMGTLGNCLKVRVVLRPLVWRQTIRLRGWCL